MPTNPYFNNYYSTAEQSLHRALVIESIKTYGIDLYYLPRTVVSKDEIYGEDDLSEYNSALQCEMYIKDVAGFQGESDFLSKFNLQIRDQVTFTVAREPFEDNIGTPGSLVRPREGDIIFFPFTGGKMFQIKHVENESMFYPLGSLQVYDMKCETFEYSGERFNTGISAIDTIMSQLDTSSFAHCLLAENGKAIITDDGHALILEQYNPSAQEEADDAQEIQDEGEDVLDFSEINPFSENII